MRVAQIQIFYPHQTEYNKKSYSYPLLRPAVKQYGGDVVSFGNKLMMTGKEFKKFGHYMPDLYTGGPMLTGSALNKMKSRGFFRGPIKDVVKRLLPYKKKYLENNELLVFERIEEAAKHTPDIDLSQLFKNWYQDTRSKFRVMQKPNFEMIKTLGANLPPDYIQPFYKFMERTDRKLYDEPIRQEFSIKEFSYKLMKMVDKVSDTNFTNRIQKLLDLLSHESFQNPNKPLPPELVKKVFDFKNLKVPENVRKNVYYEKHLKPYEISKKEVQIKLLETIQEVAERKGLKKMSRLCSDNINMILGIPVRVPFSNKTFVYDLKELLANMPDEALKKRMIALAENLPSSSNSPEALILKLNETDNDIIGDRLFNPSLVSIEHMKAQSKGGEDAMTNCALAKRWINTLRGNRPLWEVLQMFPEQNQQKYAKHLVKLNHSGKVKYEDALGHLETLENEGHIDLKAYKAKLKKTATPGIPFFKKNKK